MTSITALMQKRKAEDTSVDKLASLAKVSSDDPIDRTGSYKALGLSQLFLANGKRIAPVDGYYDSVNYPEEEREEIYEQLLYYAKGYQLVELVGDAPSAE